MPVSLSLSLGAGVLAIVSGLVLIRRILKLPAGSEKMAEIASAIQVGARAYIVKQYRVIGIIAAALFVILGFGIRWEIAFGFLVGAIFSAAAGIIGMSVSVRANVRTAEAAKQGLKKALSVAVQGGAVTGLLVVGLGLLGVAGFYAITGDVKPLIGLSFGGSLI